MKRLFIILLLSLPLGSFSSRPLTWVALGDSITYLNEHPDETGNRVKKGYLSRVKEDIPGLEYINKGYNGWTAQGIARKIEHLNLVKADVYSIFLGTNDWWSGRPVGTLADYTQNTGPDTYYGSLRVIIDKIRRLDPDAPILLITPLQRGDFVYIANMKNNAYGSYKEKNGQSLAAFADAVIAIGKQENLPVVDLYYKSKFTARKMVKYKRLKDPAAGTYRNYPYPRYLHLPFNPATDAYPYPPEAANMTYDGLHPSDKGNAEIARLVGKAMKKALN